MKHPFASAALACQSFDLLNTNRLKAYTSASPNMSSASAIRDVDPAYQPAKPSMKNMLALIARTIQRTWLCRARRAFSSQPLLSQQFAMTLSFGAAIMALEGAEAGVRFRWRQGRQWAPIDTITRMVPDFSKVSASG
jgi:hypothetical protein